MRISIIALLLGIVLAGGAAQATPVRAQVGGDSSKAITRTDTTRRDTVRPNTTKRRAPARAQWRSDAGSALLRTGGLAALVLLALFTGGLLFLCLTEIRNGHPPALESHWGGFGGAGGGWRMSPSLTYLVVALLFGAMLTALGARLFDAADAADAQQQEAAADSAARH